MLLFLAERSWFYPEKLYQITKPQLAKLKDFWNENTSPAFRFELLHKLPEGCKFL